MFAKLSLATVYLAAVSAAHPATTAARVAVRDKYVFYKGDGSTGAGWPSQSAWASFHDLWFANVPLMQQSCGWNGWGTNDSPNEIQAIKDAIHDIQGATGVDSRFILAVMMQESKGCVRVPTTNNGVRNPGLMQSHNGAGTCANVNPCPSNQVTQMIKDGTFGTSSGAGLKQLLTQARSAIKDNGSRSFYAAARLYNSGSADYSDLDNGLGSTVCYASDIANRLTGWTLAASNCQT
ncbi:hypothetical protein OIDMADRAFT_133358 [Oidiodendron maius Zn]|uniref:Glycoside hydrolase family 23 protein n=1 Tax=Oidiodendron maius (strain Zn) TaxID=913774 RepID=A0A0C3GHX4_OIDMZ|nr:hypothetical protein OIDMADRAFT_133358 [Oidiodendron maius Zn]